MQGKAPRVSYEVNGNEYDKPYYLVDGIYPDWATLVKTVRNPNSEKTRRFAKMQEACRKDVERGFGVLQARWAIVRHPARTWSLKTMHEVMTCYVIMHNMIVENERHDGRNENHWEFQGPTSAAVDPAKMTSEELHAHFTHLLGGHATDVDARLADVDAKLTDALDKMDGLEAAFNSKLDAKFQELLTRLPQPRDNVRRRARRVPRAEVPAGTAPAAAAAPEAASDEGYDDYGGEEELVDENVLDGEEVEQPAPGRPRQLNRNARPPPRPVCDDDHVAKLKLNIPLFEGRYNPDAYLT
ncbi:hypothetical protein QYE76_000782 [Lolium multiflorum]|uniref:Uncharacterized protein n=1 Tax=Lolium multiflorum TaxID=4521 RepID=A0AAD8RKS9_LOLMU|nr:hypothetical protein QYE76_000782 [Lolium multiflorum]